MQPTWTRGDPLGEALRTLPLRGVFYCRSELTAPWGLELPPFPGCMMFHVPTLGRCRLEVEGAPPTVLMPGELALVAHGAGHRLASDAGVRAARLFDLPRELASERYELLRHGGGGEPATVICGLVRFDHPAARRLARLLPTVLHVASWGAEGGEWLQGTLRFMAEEARTERPGGDVVLTRLADVLVVQAIRAWIARDDGPRDGWLAALRDPQLGRALALLHREPERDWTVAALAAAAAMSRSAFAARFSEVLGETPMRYAARWRMQIAETELEGGESGVAALAERLGYRSEAAFSRAFKRIVGVPPAVVRRRSTASTAPPAVD